MTETISHYVLATLFLNRENARRQGETPTPGFLEIHDKTDRKGPRLIMSIQTSRSTATGLPDRRTLANAVRALSMDAVQAANSGHPGMPMGMADIAEVLWNDYLKHNPDRATGAGGHECGGHGAGGEDAGSEFQS